MWLTRFALKQPTVITLFFAAVALFGIIGYLSMGVNANPNVQFPDISMVAVYPGASPQEMERLIIRPIEDQLQNVRHVEKIYARGREGVAFIDIQLKLGTDINAAANDVQQALNQARPYLPSDFDPPSIEKDATSTGSILT